jgi:hypothetical protein
MRLLRSFLCKSFADALLSLLSTFLGIGFLGLKEPASLALFPGHRELRDTVDQGLTATEAPNLDS